MSNDEVKRLAEAAKLAREALTGMSCFVATEVVESCNGNKCRERWCSGCSGDAEAEKAIAEAMDSLAKTRQAVAALDAALSASAEPMEPVARIVASIYGDASVQWRIKPRELPPGTQLYTTPPAQAEPSAQEPVAGWRHSHTHCLYETEEEVELADGDSWAEPLYTASTLKSALENERQQFQRETLRTSELSALLLRWVERHEAEHGTGPWARGCEVCKLVGDTRALLDGPINATPTPQTSAQEPDVPDIIAGALQCSRAYAYTLMERALAERNPQTSASVAADWLPYLSKMPSLDPAWSEEIRDGWMRCFNTLRKLTTQAAPVAAAVQAPAEGAHGASCQAWAERLQATCDVCGASPQPASPEQAQAQAKKDVQAVPGVYQIAGYVDAREAGRMKASRLLRIDLWGEDELGTRMPLYQRFAAPTPSPAPAQGEPLTEAQRRKMRDDTFSTGNPFCPCDQKTFDKVTRAVERAHGIGVAK